MDADGGQVLEEGWMPNAIPGDSGRDLGEQEGIHPGTMEQATKGLQKRESKQERHMKRSSANYLNQSNSTPIAVGTRVVLDQQYT